MLLYMLPAGRIDTFSFITYPDKQMITGKIWLVTILVGANVPVSQKQKPVVYDRLCFNNAAG